MWVVCANRALAENDKATDVPLVVGDVSSCCVTIYTDIHDWKVVATEYLCGTVANSLTLFETPTGVIHSSTVFGVPNRVTEPSKVVEVLVI